MEEAHLLENLPVRSQPRVDYTLRWLLKYLGSYRKDSRKGEEPILDQPQSFEDRPWLNSRAWSLLRALAFRTSTTNVARLFREHRLLDSVVFALSSITKTELDTLGQPFSNDGSLAGKDVQTSSSDETVVALPKANRKRKRGQEEPENQVLAHRSVFTTICDLLRSLDLMMGNCPTHVPGFYMEHLEVALLPSPEQAARLIRSSMRFVNAMDGLPCVENHDDQNLYHQELEPFLTLWDRASEMSEGPDRVKVHLRFASSCMLPMLDHLRRLSKLVQQASNIFKTSWVKRVEEIMIKHVVLPSREAYLNANRPTKTRDQAMPDTLAADLLEPLRKEAQDLGAIEDGKDHRQSVRATAERVAIIFGLAADNPSRDTPKQKAAENSWLQRFFGMLIDISTSYDAEKNGTLDARKYECHHPILLVALEKDVRINPSVLIDLLHRHSGLFATNSGIDWGLIGISIRTDPSLWLGAGSTTPDTLERSPDERRNLLTPLLKRLSECRSDVLLEGASRQRNLVDCIIFPLIDAFVKNRRLADFIKIWLEQIKLLHEKYQHQSSAYLWGNERLVRHMSNIIEANLTYVQIRSLIDQYSDDLAQSHDTATKSCSSHLVVLDSVLSANFGQRARDESLTSVNRLYEEILAVVLKDMYETPERAWKLVTIIRERWRSTEGFTEIERKALQQACNAINSNATQISQPSEWTFRYTLSGIQHITRGSFTDRDKIYDASVESILNLLRALKLPGFSENPSQQINGLTADQRVFLLFSSLILMPGILEVLPLEVISSFFGVFYDITESTMYSEQIIGENAESFTALWQIALSQVNNEYSTKVLGRFTKIIAMNLCGRNAIREKCLATDTIPRTSIAHLSKSIRTKMADRLCLSILEAKENDTSTLCLLRALLELSEQSPNCSDVFSETSGSGDKEISPTIFAMAARLDRDRQSRVNILQEIEYLRRITAMELHSRNGNPEHEKVVFDNILMAVKSANNGLSKKLHRSYATLAVLEACLSYLVSRTQAADQQQQEDIHSLRTHLLHLLQSELVKRIDVRDSSSYIGMSVLLDCLHGCSDIIRKGPGHCSLCGHRTNDKKLIDFLQNLKLDDMVIGSQVLQDSDSVVPIDLYNRRDALLVDIHKGAEIPGSFSVLLQGLKRASGFQSRHRLLRHWQDKIGHSHPSVEDALQQIVNVTESEKFTDVLPILILQHLLPLGMCFPKQTQPDSHNGKDSDGTTEIPKDRETFTRLLNSACNTAAKSSDAPMCILSLRCVNVMLRSKTHMITQWHIDSVMACIAITASHIKLRYEPKAASHIHTALTRVFGSILAAHRLRLGGRFHMILLALKALLICLPTPFDPPKDLRSHIDHSDTFTATHAENLSRILSSICDPTVSAVSHRRAHQNAHGALNDETKKARSEAGKHMLYFIMDFCVLQLSARMVGEGMSERLLPGIWAVLNVMSRDIMGAMNAQLGPQGREIWRELYAEWKREGKGREEG